ncbi:MAG: hypothetical protein QOD84_1214, partial [Acidobacteriaceae bacterium]
EAQKRDDIGSAHIAPTVNQRFVEGLSMLEGVLGFSFIALP